MRPWFWAWLVVAVAAGLVAALMRDRASAPFAAGAVLATAIEGLGGSPAWEWAAFAGVSFVLFVALNRRVYRPRHAHDPAGRHSAAHRARSGDDV